MSWEPILVTHVWRFLTVRELTTLLYVCTYIQRELLNNHLVVKRVRRFLLLGIHVLNYYDQLGKSCEITRQHYLRQLHLVQAREPFCIFEGRRPFETNDS